MIAIELGSRRRIRINGEISRPAENTRQLIVREAYPNCPKYITRRVVITVATGTPLNSETDRGKMLEPEQQNLLTRGDVLFIATPHPTRGADESHLGAGRSTTKQKADQNLEPAQHEFPARLREENRHNWYGQI